MDTYTILKDGFACVQGDDQQKQNEHVGISKSDEGKLAKKTWKIS